MYATSVAASAALCADDVAASRALWNTYHREYDPIAVLTQRLRMQGLIVFDWAERIPEAIEVLGRWHKEGRLVIREDVRKGGIDKFVETLNLLYTGGNNGKLVLEFGA